MQSNNNKEKLTEQSDAKVKYQKGSDLSIMLEEHGGPTENIWTTTRFILSNGIVSLFLHDFGANVKAFCGDDEYEETIKLSAIDSDTFIDKIGINEKYEDEVKAILQEKIRGQFGDYVQGFRRLCDDWGLKITSSSWY